MWAVSSTAKIKSLGAQPLGLVDDEKVTQRFVNYKKMFNLPLHKNLFRVSDGACKATKWQITLQMFFTGLGIARKRAKPAARIRCLSPVDCNAQDQSSI